jgi:hypothetical protein
MFLQKFNIKSLDFDANVINNILDKPFPIICPTYKNLCDLLQISYQKNKKMELKQIEHLKTFLNIEPTSYGKSYIIYNIIDKNSDSYFKTKEKYNEFFLEACEGVLCYLYNTIYEDNLTLDLGLLSLGNEIELFNKSFIKFKLDNPYN